MHPVCGSYQRVCGVDVAKKTLEARIQVPGQPISLGVNNDLKGIQKLVKLCAKHQVQILVAEATGGLERLLAQEAQKANLPVAIINPSRIRHYALAEGCMAKTDPVDAQVICSYGLKIAPAPTALRTAYQEKLVRLAVRRDQLIHMRTQELNRQQQEGDEDNLESIQAVLKALDNQIQKIDRLLDEHVKKDPTIQAKAQAADQTTGIGRVSAVALVAYLPELGTITRQQVAALAGLAPYENDSGQHNGQAHIHGGRASVRRTLYMCTLTAIRHDQKIKAFYQHLLKQGKKKMVALTACMRKLLVIVNARVRDALAAANPAEAVVTV